MKENENTEPTVFWLRPERIPALTHRVALLAKRARKLGLTPIGLVHMGERKVPVLDRGRPTGADKIEMGVRFDGEAPRLSGHTFVARVEHTDAGNIVARAPGEHDAALPSDVRTGDATCDHCRTARRRHDTFVLRRDEDGAMVRIGRNCLADHLRGADPAVALRIWSLLDEAIREATAEDGEGGGGVSVVFEPRRFVAAAFRDVHLNGWRSRREAELRNVQSTADAAVATFFPPRGTATAEEREAWRNAQPTERELGEADEALAWAKGLEGRSDYEHNLRVACSLDIVGRRQVGIVASVTAAYMRHVEREFQRARDLERSRESRHFGKVGSKYVRRLTVTGVRERDGDYGLKTLVSFEDDDGNRFKWWKSGALDEDVERGTELWACFDVKRHDEYRGALETTIQRASLSVQDERPAPTKWIADDGEYFRTKKAMLAAAASTPRPSVATSREPREDFDAFAAFDAAE